MFRAQIWLRRAVLVLALLGVSLAVTGREAGAAESGPRGWLGVQMGASASESGVSVARVADPSPAHAAGILEGDVLLAVDGQRLASPKDLVRRVAGSRAGATLKLSLARGGEERLLEVVLAAHPGSVEALQRFFVGRPAPGLEGTSPVQGTFATGPASWRGQVVLIDFWASWCGSCKSSVPELARMQQRYGDQGLRVVGVTSDETEEASAAVKSWQIPYAVLADPGLAAIERYGVGALPTMVVVDRAGVVRQVLIGYDQEQGAKLQRTVEELLAVGRGG